MSRLGSWPWSALAAITLVLMLASPVRPPPPLASIHEGATRIDVAGAPDLSRFQARDGTWLAYRLYPGAERRDKTESRFWRTARPPVRSKCMPLRRRSPAPA